MSPKTGLPFLLLVLVTGCGVVLAPPAENIQGRWWTWASSEGEDTNPVTDTTGEFCARNQPADVWFLAGTFGGTVRRTCMIPAGRPLVLPLVNKAGTRAQCAEFMATAKGKATLDGKQATPERMEDDDVLVTGVPGNPQTGEEGPMKSFACGLWVRLSPLNPGRHVLTIRGSSAGFRTGVDYTLIVKPEQRA